MSLTYKEIHETFDSLTRIDKLVGDEAASFAALAKRASKIVYLGCGSSYSLAKGMARITRMHLGVESMAIAGGDLLVHAPAYAKGLDGALIVCVSRSGSTSELIYAIEALRKLGCKFSVATICCKARSELAQMSERSLEMPWAFDESVCQTRSVTCLFFAQALLIAHLASDAELLEGLRKAMGLVPAFLEKAEPFAKQLAQEAWTHAVVLADAQLSGIAEEGALAYKEICQLPSNFYNILDSRHGPMVLFKADTLVVIAASTPISGHETKFVEDIAKKGCKVVLYSDLPATIAGVDNIPLGAELAHAARGIPFIMLNQLIAYYKSGYTGANPDKPDGLDAWIKL